MGETLREKLAALAHCQWSGWMDYLFSKCIDYKPDSIQAEDGAVIMPKWAVDRWKKQAKTPYPDLTPAEMDSDRTEADKFLAVFTAESIRYRKRAQEAEAKLKAAENDVMWLKAENIALAKLTSDDPEFYNPVVVAGAKAIRDRILKAIKK